MNKSTPLNQLPSLNGQNTFVNEQQRHMVMQAQSAVNALPMPQNTQSSGDMTNDDDATIQEVLNQLHGGSDSQMVDVGMSQPPQQQQQPPMMPPQLMNQQISPQMMPQPVVQFQPPKQVFDPYTQAQYTAQYPQQQQTQDVYDPLQTTEDNQPLSFLATIAEDVKFGAFIFILFVVVHFVPLDKFLMRYLALDRIPYYDVLLKAIMAFVVVVLSRKFLTKW